MKISIFLQKEGDTPKNRILSFLIVHSDFDYSMKDIARYSNVGYTTLKEIWVGFKEKMVVVETRVVGKAKMYKLNIENSVVKKFIDYYWAVIDAVVRRENNIIDEPLHEQEPSHYQNSSAIIARMPVYAKGR